MKVLIDHQLPFALAHGGLQVQIERTKAALEESGLEVEYLRWWDAEQKGDIIHFFGRANPGHIQFAHGKGIRYVMSELLTGQGSRSRVQLRLQAALERGLRAAVPPTFLSNFRWEAYTRADAVIVLTAWEAEIVRMLFGTPEARLHVVPNGVEPEFFRSPGDTTKRGDELVCTATITERKRVLEVAEAAIIAQIPLRVLGAPYGDEDPYYLRFSRLATNHPNIIRYNGPVNSRKELARFYKSARGFVLLSTMESLSLSALEAAAAGCPLLLSDLPWARYTFGDQAVYCPLAKTNRTAGVLRQFFEEAPRLPTPPAPLTWDEVAMRIDAVYRQITS